MRKSNNNVGRNNESNRVKWIQETLEKIPSGMKILDAGAGECQFKKYCSHLEYTSQDFAQYDGKGDVGLQTGTWDNTQIDIVSDITNIPLESNTFDAILCTEVFEHIIDPVTALNELTRLLKPKGFLILTAPFASLTHFAPYHYSTGFSRFFYETHLANRGFEIMDLQLNGNFFEYLAQENRRIPSIAKKYSNVRLNYFENKVIALMLKILGKLSKKDQGSSDLLCFGIHVFAKKQELLPNS